MATLTAVNPRVVGGYLATTEVHAATSTTWKKGEWLRVDTSGVLQVVASDADAGTGGIQYVALVDRASSDAAGLVTVGVITADIIFEMNELDGAIAVADIGQLYGIDVTSNVVTLDDADTSNPAVKVVRVGSHGKINNVDADTKAKVYASVLQSVIDAARAA